MKPNILLIMSDDHTANAISAYKSRLAPVFKTPNIDRIAKEGVLATNCHCTNAICTPSRASILTGQHSHTNGVRTLADRLNPDLNTFPKMFQAAGYQTAIFGKWHVHCEPKGFDTYNVLPGQGLYFDPYFLDSKFDWAAMKNPHNSRQGTQHKGYVTDLITDMTLDYLKNRDKEKPFLLFCHHKAPHDDFEYHPRHEHLLDGVTIPEPENLWEDHARRDECTRYYGTSVSDRNPFRNSIQMLSRKDHPTGTVDFSGLDAKGRTQKAYQKYLHDYLRCVAAIDEGVGRVLDYLDAEKLTENTIVIYTSDQGMFLGEHDYIDKRWIYDEALQMPFLMRYPREILDGSVNHDIFTNVDFAPTLLEFAGLNPTPEMQGRSARLALTGHTSKDWPQQLYYRYWMHMTHHHNPAHYGIRTQRYKLIHFYGLPLDASEALPYSTPPGWEFYDLQTDPRENENRYHDPKYSQVIADLKEQLRALKHQLGDDDARYPEMLSLPTAL